MGEIITLVSIGVFVLFALIGFLTGLVRGMKKSALKLIITIAALFIAGAITPWISSILLENLSLSFIGFDGNVNDFVLEKLFADASIKEMADSSPALLAMISALPILFLNLIVFMLAVFAINILGGIVYLILAHIFIKKQKTVEVNGKKQIVKAKKYKLLGGLINAAQTLILFFAFLIPINGIISTVGEISAIPAAASENSSPESDENKSASATLIEEIITEEGIKLIKDYNNGILGTAHRIVSFDNFFFDSLASVNVSGEKFVLRKELINASRIYNDVDYLLDLFGDKNIVYLNIDFNRIERVIDNIFNIGGVSNIGAELTVYFLDKAIRDGAFTVDGYETESVTFFSKVLDDIKQNPDLASTLESDVKAVFNVVKVLCLSGVVDAVIDQKNIDFSEIRDLLTVNSNAPIGEIIKSIYSSHTIRTIFAEGVNFGIEILEGILNGGDIARVDPAKINWESGVSTETFNFITKLIEIAPEYTQSKDISIRTLIDTADDLGEILDMLKDSSIFKAGVGNADIYLSVLNALNNSEYGEWFDFSVLTGNGIYKKQFGILGQMLTMFDELAAASNGKINFKSYNYESFKGCINNFLDSEVYEGIKYGAVSAMKEDYINNIKDKTAREILDAFFNSLNESNMHEMIRENLLTVYDVVEVFGRSGILDAAISGRLDVSIMIEGLSAIGQEKFKTVVDKITSGEFIQIASKSLIDKMVGEFDSNIVPKASVNWEESQVKLNLFVGQLYNFLDIIEDLSLDKAKLNPLLILGNDSISDRLLGNGISEDQNEIGLLTEMFKTLREINFLIDTNGISYIDVLLQKFKFEGLTVAGEPNETFVALGKVSKILRTANVFSVFNDIDGWELSEAKQGLIVEKIIAGIGSTVDLSELIMPLVESNFLKSVVILPILESFQVNGLGGLIDVDVLKDASVSTWEKELEKINVILTRFNTAETVFDGVRKTYFRYVLDGGDIMKLVRNFTYDGDNNDIDVIMNAALESDIFSPIINSLLKTISDGLANSFTGATIPPTSKEDLREQKSEFINVIKLILTNLTTFEEGFNYSTSDKTALAELLDALKENRYRKEIADDLDLAEGMFRNVYEAIISNIADTVGPAFSNAMALYENPWDVNFVQLFSMIDALLENDFSITTGVIDSLKDVVFGITNDSDAASIVEEVIPYVDEIISAVTNDLSTEAFAEEVEELINSLSSYEKEVIDNTLDIIMAITGIEELERLKGILEFASQMDGPNE